MSDPHNEPPVVTVVAGSPTPEELAAILTVLTAAAASTPGTVGVSDRPPAGGWKSYVRTLRRAAYPGPGAWRDINN